MSLKNILAFAFAFFVMIAARADVTVQAVVDRNEMEPDDVLTYTISISHDSGTPNISSPRLPKLNNFQVINEWTSEEQRASMVTTPQGGREFKTVRSQSFNFILQPTQAGMLSIGAAEVEVDGKTYRTKPITLKVMRGAGAKPQTGQKPSGGQPSQAQRQRPQMPPGFQMPNGFDEEDEDLFAQLLQHRGGVPSGQGFQSQPINPNEAFFIQLEVDKTDAFVGEQVTASWYIYTRGQIRDLDTLKYPSLRGFWKEDIEIATQLNYTDEVINGIPYRKALLASYALFPIKEGQALIDPYQAKCSVVIGDGFGGKAYTYTKSSQPLKINVRALPNEGRPADFSGAVGQFQVTARVEDPSIVTDQPFSYKIRFEGRGNAKTIDLPPFQVPEGMELYDTQKDAKFFRTGTSYKDFNLLLIPRREGTFTIPQVGVAIFDPIAKRYVQKQTEAITVVVRKGQGGAAISANPLSTTKPEAARPGVLPGPVASWNSSRALSSGQQGVACLALVFAVISTLIWRMRIELGFGQRKKDLRRQLVARLKKVRARLQAGDWRGVGLESTNTANFILGEVRGLGGANVELEKLLAQAPPSIRRELEVPLTKILERVQILTFAPSEVVGPLKDPENLKKLVSEFERLMEQAVAIGVSSEQDGT